MAKFQLLRCSVALGGDTDTVVVRHRTNPILFPELMMLQFLHGEDAVTDVHVVGTCEMPQEEALTRLRVIYTEEEVTKVFPGARPSLPMADRSIPICDRPVHKPGPTRPDNPDPTLKPLDQYALAEAVPDDDSMPGFDNPTPYTGAEDEDPGLDPLMMEDNPGLNRPQVQDQPQTRTSFQGQAGQARKTPSHLPDVTGRAKKHGENEHDRPKG